VSEEFSNHQNAGESWCTSIKYGTLFEGVKECVAGITDIATASACLYFYINKTPPGKFLISGQTLIGFSSLYSTKTKLFSFNSSGADQLIAAKLCLQYTEKLAESQDCADSLEKVQTKYLTLATTHVLHLCGLGERKYLESVGCPEKLCHDLYQHPAIIDFCLGQSAQCPSEFPQHVQ